MRLLKQSDGEQIYLRSAQKQVLYSRSVPETVRSLAGTSTAVGACAVRNASLQAIPGGGCSSELETDGEAHRVSIQNNEY
jgi:hypothetical protein